MARLRAVEPQDFDPAVREALGPAALASPQGLGLLRVLAQRPDLTTALWGMATTWPAFLDHDPVADVYYPRLPEVFPAHQLVGLDAAGRVVGRVLSVPFAWSGEEDDLPDRGWDAVLERAFRDHREGRRPTAVSLLEAALVPELLGTGQSYALLRAARESAEAAGVAHLVAPVRPTRKCHDPRSSLVDYALRVRPDGLPVDPWLRVHARLGARLVKVAPVSMVVPGTLAQWREWTGLDLRESGWVDVPGALAPVHVSVEHDHAVYVEPNVWVHYALGQPDAAGAAAGAAAAGDARVGQLVGAGALTRARP